MRPQRHITHRLEAPARLKRPGHLVPIAEEEEAHLHRVAKQPIGQHADAEAFAGSRGVVRQHLGEGEGGFDGEADDAEEGGVEKGGGGGGGEDGVEGQEGEGEEEEELPVSVRSQSQHWATVPSRKPPSTHANG